MVGRIRHMSTLRPRLVVLLGRDEEDSRRGSIGGIVHIVGGWGLIWSRLLLSGIGIMGGSSSNGIIGLSVANWREISMLDMSEPRAWCACAMW